MFYTPTNMSRKPALWILFLLVMIATNASSQTVGESGAIGVTVYVEGTRTPIPGVLVSLTPCPNCQPDKPAKEADLLDYLRALAVARRVHVAEINDLTTRTMPVQAALTVGSGSLTFQNVKFGKYEVVALKQLPQGGSSGPVVFESASLVVIVDADQRAPIASLYLSGQTPVK